MIEGSAFARLSRTILKSLPIEVLSEMIVFRISRTIKGLVLMKFDLSMSSKKLLVYFTGTVWFWMKSHALGSADPVWNKILTNKYDVSSEIELDLFGQISLKKG